VKTLFTWFINWPILIEYCSVPRTVGYRKLNSHVSEQFYLQNLYEFHIISVCIPELSVATNRWIEQFTMRKNCYKRDKPANHIKCLPSTTSAYRIRLGDTVETMSFTVETGDNRPVHFRKNSVKNGLVFLVNIDWALAAVFLDIEQPTIKKATALNLRSLPMHNSRGRKTVISFVSSPGQKTQVCVSDIPCCNPGRDSEISLEQPFTDNLTFMVNVMRVKTLAAIPQH
jgi:hypothetical protein